ACRIYFEIWAHFFRKKKKKKGRAAKTQGAPHVCPSKSECQKEEKSKQRKKEARRENKTITNSHTQPL
ncbi:hypothetical protein IscW_ISCW017404, partial [Ixodes scapularis]